MPYQIFDLARARLNHWLVTYLARTSLNGSVSMVLEAGSGTAVATSLFARHAGVFSVAVDHDLEALLEARRRDPALPVVVGDLYALPFKTETFDLVWNNSTLEHLDGPERALAEMHRIAKRRKYVFVGVPYRWGPLAFQPWIRRTRIGIWLGDVFAPADLMQLMRRVTLEPRETIVYYVRMFMGVLAQKS